MYPIFQELENCRITEQLLPVGDGTRLYTRTIVPRGAEKYPIVFIRTPYDTARNGVPYTQISDVEERYIRAGYAVVRQHCRGTGDSEGICIPYANERADGLDALEQVRKLPFYNGEIFLWGESYLTSVHLLYLNTAPADVKGAVLAIQTDRMFFHKYRNGCCYDIVGNTNWYLDRLRRQYPDQDRSRIGERPYKDIMLRAVGENPPGYADMQRNDTYNDYWKQDPRTTLMENLKLPVLFLEGWYDFYLGGMFSMWQRFHPEGKARSAFVVGPWGHSTRTARNCPYPLPNGNIPEDSAVQWFDSIRRGTPYPYAETGKLTYYSLGSGSWYTEPQSQPAPEKLYFGEGLKLTGTPLSRDLQITYRYDPDDAPGCFRHNGIFPGHQPNTVPGVITFLSEPADTDREYFGSVRWHMTVSSDCEDTAFFFRVSLVEEGVSYNLTQGITALSHIKPDYSAGMPVTVDLDTTPMAFTLKKGCRIRVDISSHSDIFLPHPTVRGHWAEVTEARVANNILHLKEAYIALPRK